MVAETSMWPSKPGICQLVLTRKDWRNLGTILAAVGGLPLGASGTKEPRQGRSRLAEFKKTSERLSELKSQCH